MFEQLINSELTKLNMDEVEPEQYSPLVLAYIGDVVYELYIRSFLVRKGNTSVHKLHKQATRCVKAKAQSESILYIEEKLTPEELRIFKRGRNAKAGTTPKNADLGDYRRATGFEALMGYLYLKGEIKRLMELLELSASIHIGV